MTVILVIGGDLPELVVCCTLQSTDSSRFNVNTNFLSVTRVVLRDGLERVLGPELIKWYLETLSSNRL